MTDDGAAIKQAGRPAGWRALASQLERELDVNITRHGVVWLPVVAAGPGLDTITARIAQASVIFYEELLDLEV